MNNPPLVSVLMTVYNAEEFIRDAIESVLIQTMPDFEFIIVDDRSTDRSFEIAQSYTSDPRVRLYKNEKNLGDFPNRNCAARYARGKYLKYVDCDDAIYPHCLEVYTSALELYPEAGIAASRQKFINSALPLYVPSQVVYEEENLGLGPFISVIPANSCIRRSVFEAIGGFVETKEHCNAGRDYWMRATAKSGVVLVVPGLMYYRRHQNTEGQRYSTRSDLRTGKIRMMLDMLKRPDCPLNEEQRVRAAALLKNGFLKRQVKQLFQRRIGVREFMDIARGINAQWSDFRNLFTLKQPKRHLAAFHALFNKAPQWAAYPMAKTEYIEPARRNAPVEAESKAAS